MRQDPLLDLPGERRALELRRVREREDADAGFARQRRLMMWQCVALSFLGVPVYAASWGSADPRMSQVWSALGLFVSYAAPFFRWLVYHIRVSDEFR